MNKEKYVIRVTVSLQTVHEKKVDRGDGNVIDGIVTDVVHNLGSKDLLICDSFEVQKVMYDDIKHDIFECDGDFNYKCQCYKENYEKELRR